MTESLINRLLTHFGFSSTVYKPVAKIADISDMAIVLIEWSDQMEAGRHAVFVRDMRTAKRRKSHLKASGRAKADKSELFPLFFCGNYFGHSI